MTEGRGRGEARLYDRNVNVHNTHREQIQGGREQDDGTYMPV